MTSSTPNQDEDRTGLATLEKDLAEKRLTLTAEIVSAYLRRNVTPASEITRLISETHSSLAACTADGASSRAVEVLRPAVPIEKSLTDEFVICLEDGLKFKSMKRHLRTQYNLTPEEYRRKWDLSPSYPMVARNYAKKRSELARASGLGKRPLVAEPVRPAEPVVEAQPRAQKTRRLQLV